MDDNELHSAVAGWSDRAPEIGALIGAFLVAAFGMLGIVGVRVPVISELLFLPAGMLTWLLIWGNHGTDFENAVTVVSIAAVIDSVLGYLVGLIVRFVVRQPVQFSLKALLFATAVLCAGIALPAWSWLIIVPLGSLLAAYAVAAARIARQ